MVALLFALEGKSDSSSEQKDEVDENKSRVTVRVERIILVLRSLGEVESMAILVSVDS